MLIPPKYTLTKKMVASLQTIEANREVINSVSIPIEIEENIRRTSTLRSSLFSARVEGNTLTLDELGDHPSNNQKKSEIWNILKALGWLKKRERKDMTIGDLLELHKITMKNIHPDAGRLRSEFSATFNSAGIAIYMHPPHEIMPRLKRLIKFSNSDKESLLPIKACLVHYTFEKIHPFLDGNGRIGRLLLQKTLMHGGYGMKGLMALEEFIDEHRSEYYRALEEPDKDSTDYLLFMLEAIAIKSTEAKELVLQKNELTVEDYLLPRRGEILKIIKDHKLINFDSIKRRFDKVNERTLRYDLKSLQDQGLVRKRGSTKGVYYEPITN